MYETPEKNTSIGAPLTPVRFLDTPKTNSNSTDSTYSLCKTKLDTIVKILSDNHQKWILAHKRGQSLCQSIEAIKTRNLNTSSEYPKELKLYCEKLAIVSSVFEDITGNATKSYKQLCSLAKLQGIKNIIFYRSWTINEFIEFIKRLIPLYETETKVKLYVMEEIAHCSERYKLIRCSTAWEYPQHVDDWVNLHFLFLTEETKGFLQ